MKIFHIIALTFLIIISCFLVLPAFSYEGFEVKFLSDEQGRQVFESRDFVLHLGEDNLKTFDQAISSFDVSPSKQIALGLQDGYVLVLDADGNVLWWLSFNNIGTTYVQWQQENLLVAGAKFSCIFEFTNEGTYVRASLVLDGSSINNSSKLDISHRQSVAVEKDNFTIRKGLAIFGYSKLIKVDAEGNETILYDVEADVITRTVVWIIIILLVFGGTFCIVLHQERERIRDKVD